MPLLLGLTSERKTMCRVPVLSVGPDCQSSICRET